MSQQMTMFDEGLAEVRANAMLRALAELDALEPSRALDRAVLGRAREAASGRPHCATAQPANTLRRLRAVPALRWGFPAAVAAAALCALVAHRTASRPGPPRASTPLVASRVQPSPNDALEMVRVSARYRGLAPRVDAAATSSPSRGSGESHLLLIPSFIETSVPLLAIRAAPLRKRGAEEWTARAVSTRESARAGKRERTARRRTQPLWLIDSVDSLDVRPPPAPGLRSALGTSSPGAQVGDARAEAAPVSPH